ncbi:MAG: sulfatase-like hydrolase/transferase [Chitinophagaceae bacterium]|nr:sulfatase-like hydrolase/transferase [Chitinophagaceae bacterium]
MGIASFFLPVLLFITCLSSAQGRPNIIYIMADDLGYADLGGYGRKDYQTPNLDKLAAQGIKFTHAYAGAPVCTPTRTAFMTGRYPARTPVGLLEPIDWIAKDSLAGLSPDYPTIATLIKNSGYKTYLIGKWHLGFSPAMSPLKNGFDEFFGFNGGAVDHITHTDPSGNIDLYENDKPVIKEGYLTDLLAERTIKILGQPHTKPFFISLMFSAPHWPWQGPGDKAYPLNDSNWRKGGSREIYASMVKSMDDAIGRIMKTLDEKKLSGNTVIIFTSDNGGERFSDMGMYQKSKMQLWEGGIRVPAFIRWPGKIRANTITNQPAITMDWTATILALAKAKPHPGFPLDGIDLMPVCTGKKNMVERTFYWRIFQRRKQKAIRDGDWKYLKDEKGEYLFHISADPGEMNNLKEEQKDIFIRLKQKYSDWEKTVLEPVPLGK